MAMGKLEMEMEVKSSADSFWGGIKDSTTIFPKIFPQRYESIEVIEGDGVDVGTVRLLKYVAGTPVVTFAKEKVELIDDANKLVAYSVIDGELLAHYKSLKFTVRVVPKGEGSLVKLLMEFEKTSEEVPEPKPILEYAAKAFTGLDAHLVQITMGKHELEFEVKSSADSFWGGIKNTTTIFPKMFPQKFQSIEVIEGKEREAGSVRIIKYVPGNPITFVKEKVELFDEANKLLVYSVIDGELLAQYKSLKFTVQIVPKGEGSLVKLHMEFEKASEEGPDPKPIFEYAAKAFTGLDAYLLQAKTN